MHISKYAQMYVDLDLTTYRKTNRVINENEKSKGAMCNTQLAKKLNSTYFNTTNEL